MNELGTKELTIQQVVLLVITDLNGKES